MNEFIMNYIDQLEQIQKKIDITAVNSLLHSFAQTREKKGRIFVIGNGGSAAIANHFAGDLGKNVSYKETGRFNVISLCDNIASITAYANDMGYENIFSEQLKNYSITPIDTIMAISSSGNSPNIMKAVEYAIQKGSCIVGLTGFDGGKLKELSHINIHIPHNEYEPVEDIHTCICHMVVSYFKKQSQGDNV